MEQASALPEAVVLGQDDRTDIRLQAVLQSGRRQVDIRVWRRGAGGMAPLRNGISVTARDLDATETSLERLVEMAARPQRVTRFVIDLAEGRRLRAEIEPFGVRFSARLGFWQRVRNSWRPVDDGLVVLCELLPDIESALRGFTPWLNQPDFMSLRRGLPAELDVWPTPAADWMTIEADRIAVHPRGLHITATRDGEVATIGQWRRSENIWLPEPASFTLSRTEIERLLGTLRGLEDQATVPLARSDLHLYRHEGLVTVEEGRPGAFEWRLTVPEAALPQLGRLLAETWRMLAPALTAAEMIVVPEPNQTGDEEVVAETEDARVGEVVTPLGEVRLREHAFTLARRQLADVSRLGLAWQDNWLDLPDRTEENVITPLRALYYETLRGRRGQSRILSEEPALRASVHNHGLQPFLVLEQENAGHATALTLPVGDIPAFLDAVEAILSEATEEARCAQEY